MAEGGGASRLVALWRRRRAGEGPLEGEILPPEGAERVDADDEARVRAGFFRTLRRALRQVPFAEDVVAAYYCALDPAVPVRVRATLMAALAYFVIPLDGIPDVLLGIGFGDDVTVLAGAIGMVFAHITDDHRSAARQALSDGAAGAAAAEASRQGA